MFAPTSFLPILSMNAHSESKRAFLLLLGLAECVAPTQEWPLAQCLFPTDRQPWDDSIRQNGIGDLRKTHSEFYLARFMFKIVGVLTRCARAHAAGETCRNPTWPDLIHSSAVRSDGRRALSLSLALEELQNLHRGFPMKGRTDRWVYAVIHGFVARFCHITEHTEEALALAFTYTPSV